jgi:hypothetical protein
MYCRDLTAERIDELVLIISNSEFAELERKLEAPGMKPVLVASNIGCWQWKGTASVTAVEGDTTTTISTDVTWTRDDTLQSGPSPLVLYKPEGTEEWKQEGFCSGSGTLPIVPTFCDMFTVTLAPPEVPTHRTYYGYGIETRDVDVICKCDPPCPASASLPTWFEHELAVPSVLRVNSEGTIDGSYDDGDGTSWKWHFEAQQQP